MIIEGINMEQFKDFEDFTEERKVEFYKNIGKNVSTLRKKHKLSQMKLSELIGHKSTSLVSGAEIYYKKQHFSLEHIALIAYVLDEDIKQFFD